MLKKRIALFVIPLLLLSSIAFGFTRDWDENDPIDHSKNNIWPAEIREVMADVAERVSGWIEGFASGETAVGVNWLPFIAQGSDASTITDQVQFYAKVVSTKTELFMIDEDGSTMQLTSGGDFIGGISGEIRMWSGTVASIPTGWELSDGSCTNTCPDLTDKFVVGATQDDGGVAKTNITGSLTQSGGDTSHDHTAGTYAVSGTTDSYSAPFTPVAGGATAVQVNGHDHDFSASTTGTSASNDHINPYYALAYIIKI